MIDGLEGGCETEEGGACAGDERCEEYRRQGQHEAFGERDGGDLDDGGASASEERDFIGQALDDVDGDEDDVEDGDRGDFEEQDSEWRLLVSLGAAVIAEDVAERAEAGAAEWLDVGGECGEVISGAFEGLSGEGFWAGVGMPRDGGGVGGKALTDVFEDGCFGDEERCDGAVFGQEPVGCEEALGGKDPERVIVLQGLDDGGDDSRKGEGDAGDGGTGGRRRAVFARDFAGAGVEVFDEPELLADGEAYRPGGFAGDGDFEGLSGGGCSGELAFEEGDVVFVVGDGLELADRCEWGNGFVGRGEEESGPNEDAGFAGGEPADALCDAPLDGLTQGLAFGGAERY